MVVITARNFNHPVTRWIYEWRIPLEYFWPPQSWNCCVGETVKNFTFMIRIIHQIIWNISATKPGCEHPSLPVRNSTCCSLSNAIIFLTFFKKPDCFRICLLSWWIQGVPSKNVLCNLEKSKSLSHKDQLITCHHAWYFQLPRILIGHALWFTLFMNRIPTMVVLLGPVLLSN